MRRSKRISLLGAGLVAVAMVGAACGSSSKSSTSSGGTGPANGSFTPVGTKIAGGTVTWAEGAGAQPTYIFPFYSAQQCSVANASQFQPLMYRSLYWYGNDQKATIDYDYSIGNAPTYSADGKTVTITMKSNYKWSDGEPVNARDVVFWMNLMKANKANWCAYVPGFFPDNVVSVTATGPYTVQFVMDKAYSPTWLVYNEFSQITPLPLAWDTTTHNLGPTTDTGNLPDTTTAGATATYKNLDGLSKDTSSYTSSPIWGVVNGPFKLSNFTTTGEADFVPNPTYGGPVKPTISVFKELPYTSEQPEVNLVQTGPASLTIGYLPVDSLPLLPRVKALGYHTLAAYTFSADYWPLNLNNPTYGPVFRQLYFRQAFQHLVDQKGWINAFESNAGVSYAIPQFGLIPTVPTNNFLAPDASTDPAPFSIATASQLLSSHGWHVVPNGTTTCTNPGSGPTQCGAGVRAGLSLSFGLDYESGVTFLDSEMKTLKSDASQAGIQLQLTTHPFTQVISTAVQCAPTDSTCGWTSENWGGGWVYSPDYYPSGEELAQTKAAANYSNYSDAKMDALVAATTTASAATAQSALNTYQDYVRQQLPFVFEPNTSGNPQPGGPTVVSQHLGGFTVNAFSYILPEQYYLTK